MAGIIETWGGELETLIVHDGASIVSRRVGVRAKRGNQNSAKRFTWTKDLVSVKRSVASDNPKTRVYGYGKGVETEGGGYGRRLTFGDINGGKDYVEDAEATTVWGHPDGEGGILPARRVIRQRAVRGRGAALAGNARLPRAGEGAESNLHRFGYRPIRVRALVGGRGRWR